MPDDVQLLRAEVLMQPERCLRFVKQLEEPLGSDSDHWLQAARHVRWEAMGEGFEHPRFVDDQCLVELPDLAGDCLLHWVKDHCR